ncbi:MAG: DUF4340 domain-containing protein [Clostridia bacterium]|nr:DUF4340 domain-containing protein [Clostridia bacterium]
MKRPAKILIMLIVLVLVIGGYIQMKNMPSDQPDMTEDGSSTIRYAANSVLYDNITKLSYENGDTTLSLKKNGDIWVLDMENAPAIDSEIADSIVKSIATPSSSNLLENVSKEKLSEYGLSEPDLRITITEGEKVSEFIFGSYNATIGEYYFCDASAIDTVFTLESSIWEMFSYTLKDLIIYDTLPAIKADSITSFSLKGENKEITIEAIKTPTETDGEYTYSATLTENGISESYSYADFYRMAEAIAEWNIDEFVCCEEQLGTEYGFDTPKTLTINYTKRYDLNTEGSSGGYIDRDESFSLILGEKDEEGYYYCKISADSRLIYKISTNIIDEIFY